MKAVLFQGGHCGAAPTLFQVTSLIVVFKNKYILIPVGVVILATAWLAYWTRDVPPNLAPFVPTPMEIVEKMLEMAEVRSDDVVYDLGCGDGRIVIAAATKYGAHGVGVEYDPEVSRLARDNVRKQNVGDRVKIIIGDALRTDVSPASIVMLYLLPDSNRKLRPILDESLKPGSRVVSHDFAVPGWKALRIERVRDYKGKLHTLYLWRIGSQYP